MVSAAAGTGDGAAGVGAGRATPGRQFFPSDKVCGVVSVVSLSASVCFFFFLSLLIGLFYVYLLVSLSLPFNLLFLSLFLNIALSSSSAMYIYANFLLRRY